MSVIKIRVDDQQIALTNMPVIASGGIEENQIEFDFSEDWDGFACVAVFYRENKSYESIVSATGVANVPNEVVATDGKMWLGVMGVRNGVTKTSELVFYKILEGAITQEFDPGEPTPDIYNQILDYVSQVVDFEQRLIVVENQSSRNAADIATQKGRIDNMINSQTNAEVKTLWTGTSGKAGTTITLSESVSNYDFLDIYTGTTDTLCTRVPVSRGSAQIQTQNMRDSTSYDNFVAFYETGITFSGSTINIGHTNAMRWDGTLTNAPTFYLNDNEIYETIKRVDGVKVGHVEDDEITDARVGYNGKQYPNLGDAIRGQFNIMNNDLSAFPFVGKSFTVSANSQHQSTADRISVDIAEGELFAVQYKSPISASMVFQYKDGTTAIINKTEYHGVAPKNISEIGIFCANNTDQDIIVSFGVGKSPVGAMILDAIYNRNVIVEPITTTTDANTLTKNLTLYTFGTANPVANIPSNINIGSILNFNGGSDYFKSQFCIDSRSNKIYFRTTNGTNWSEWVQIANQDDITVLYDSVYKQKTNVNRLFYDDGHSIDHNEYSATELIPITIPTKIRCSVNIPSGFHALLYYDSNFNVVGTEITNTNRQNIDVTITDSSVAYIRFQGRNLNFPNNTIDPTIYVFSNLTERIKNLENIVSEGNTIRLTKTSATAFNIKIPCDSGKVVRYDFSHDYKVWDSLDYVNDQGETVQATNVLSADYWNNYEVYNDTTGEHIAQGHSNMIVYRNGHYVGDGHGNEVIITFEVIADGKIIDVESLNVGAVIQCGELRTITKTKVFKWGGNTGEDVPTLSYPALDTSGNPIVDLIHCMEVEYNIGNRVVMHNKLIVQNDNTVFGCCFGAMLENYFGKFSKVIVNNWENTQNNIADDGTTTVAEGSTINLRSHTTVFANTVEMFGKNHYIKQSCENDDVTQRNKQAIYFNFYNNRLKAYFAPIRTTDRYPSGYEADVFNKNDVISVTNERIIEI